MTSQPLSSRLQAKIRYAGYCHAARGPFGPAARLNLDTLTDTLETTGVELGDYDRQVLARLAQLLGPLDCAVVNSLFQRAAHDDYDQAVYLAVPRPRPVP